MLRRLAPYLEEHHIAHEEHLGSENKEQRDIRVFDRILLLVLEKPDAHARKDRLRTITTRWLLDPV